MSLLDWILPKRKPKEPEREPPVAVVQMALSKRGLWRWKVVNGEGQTLALMPGRGHKELADCINDARRLVDSRIHIDPDHQEAAEEE